MQLTNWDEETVPMNKKSGFTLNFDVGEIGAILKVISDLTTPDFSKIADSLKGLMAEENEAFDKASQEAAKIGQNARDELEKIAAGGNGAQPAPTADSSDAASDGTDAAASTDGKNSYLERLKSFSEFFSGDNSNGEKLKEFWTFAAKLSAEHLELLRWGINAKIPLG